MYKRLYTFINDNNIIYKLQFGFRQYSTSYALINITGNIRKVIDDRNIGCGVFLDFFRLLILQTTRYCEKNWVTMGFVEFPVIGIYPICLIVISIYP